MFTWVLNPRLSLSLLMVIISIGLIVSMYKLLSQNVSKM